MFRSEDISLFEMVVSEESSWDVLSSIGLNKRVMWAGSPRELILDKAISSRIRNCDEMEQKLNVILDKAAFFNVKGLVKTKDATQTIRAIKKRFESKTFDERLQIESINEEISSTVHTLTNLVDNFESFLNRINQFKQNIVILDRIGQIQPPNFGSGQYRDQSSHDDPNSGDDFNRIREGNNPTSGHNINYFAGLLNTFDFPRFERMVFRISRGLVFLKGIPIDLELKDDDIKQIDVGRDAWIDPKTKKPIRKTLVFMVFHGKEGVLSQKIETLVKSFDMFNVDVPPREQDRQKRKSDLKQELKDTVAIYENTVKQIEKTVRDYFTVSHDTDVSKIEEFSLLIHKDKTIAKGMTYLEPDKEGGNYVKGFFWTPEKYENQLRSDMSDLQSTAKNFIKPQLRKISNEAIPGEWKKPTFYITGDFTAPFNMIVETYGIPRYKEINPGFFTIISFPYLFGVMFGDFGHGLVVLIAAIMLCMKASSLKAAGGMGQAIAGLRYQFLLMGIFATYNGFIYNDFYAVKMPFFSSCYQLVEGVDGAEDAWVRTPPDCVYPFGFDYVWGMSSNEITFFNSFKMKLSLILGIIHMTFGICLKGVNAIYFSNCVDLVFEFIPQILFFLGLFGYMALLIFIKWTKDYMPLILDGKGIQAPGIIALFSNIYVKPKFAIVGEDPDLQYNIQLALLGVAFVCVIWMLFPKPFIVHSQQKKAAAKKHASREDQEQNRHLLDETSDPTQNELISPTKSKKGASVHVEHEVEPFGELMIHQLIETIEFVLGSISNTASYLRLWALSLAHAQLAKVFLEMILGGFLTGPKNVISGTIGLTIGFMIFAGITFAVLMVMDIMECFLHTLRLHWVEFQNKFFKGDGLRYDAFCFEGRLDGE